MANIDKKELAEKSQSKFGAAVPQNENKFLKFYYNVFLKGTVFKAFINGAITTAVVIYYIFTKDVIPAYFWFGYIFFVSFTGLLYWRYEQKRLGKAIAKTEQELGEIYNEIEDRKKYFENLKDNISESKSKN